jgi:hypothetical protein
VFKNIKSFFKIKAKKNRKDQSPKPKTSPTSSMLLNDSFNEFDYESWFKSNDITENLCTFVPFVKYEKQKAAQTTSSTFQANETQQQQRPSSLSFSAIENQEEDADREACSSNETPQKRICSGLGSLRDNSEENFANTSSSSSRLGITEEKIKKAYTYESILSLLVKTLHKNMNHQNDETKNGELFELNFLLDQKKNDIKLSDLDSKFTFENTRIGDENDFTLNLLEQASKLNDKCLLNIEKTVDKINHVAKRKSIQDLTSLSTNTQFGGASGLGGSLANQSSSVLVSPTIDEELMNKKMRAKARQQKLLAQMTSSQKAFLTNPSNKNEIKALEDLGNSKKTPVTELSKTSIASESSKQLDNYLSDLTHEESQNKPENNKIKFDDADFDCCICTFSSKPSADRPIGVVALIQSTNSICLKKFTKNIEHLNLNYI